MKKAYNDIKELLIEKEDAGKNYQHLALNMTLHLAKLSEEVGEMAQSINKLNGRKKPAKGETKDMILDNIEEEAADSIQCIMAIAINAGVSYNSLKKRLMEKNIKFKNF